MTLGDKELQELLGLLRQLTPRQQRWIRALVDGFGNPHEYWRLIDSEFVSQDLLEQLGNRLISHHANSRQALSKGNFEFALESACNDVGIPARLVNSRTNRGHDIDIGEYRVSLKTEAAKGIRDDTIHVSKWMELGKGKWILEQLRDQFLVHLGKYDRILTLRCLESTLPNIRYELVEIPKALMMEARHCELKVMEDSKQEPKPGYGYVRDEARKLKFELYFDGGSERKLQVRQIRKDLCRVHATWSWSLTSPQQTLFS